MNPLDVWEGDHQHIAMSSHNNNLQLGRKEQGLSCTYIARHDLNSIKDMAHIVLFTYAEQKYQNKGTILLEERQILCYACSPDLPVETCCNISPPGALHGDDGTTTHVGYVMLWQTSCCCKQPLLQKTEICSWPSCLPRLC